MGSRLEHADGTWPADGLMFTTRTGRPIEPRAVGRRFDLRCAKAGVRRIRVHDTRRTCGSLLAAFDVHPRVAMRILRHSKIAITMELYTMVPTRRHSLRSSGSATLSAPLTPRYQMMRSRYPLLYAAAVQGGQVFEKCVELRGLEPLAFWMQTRRSSS